MFNLLHCLGMLFFFWKVAKIFFEYFYQYLPLSKTLIQIWNLSVATGREISGKKKSHHWVVSDFLAHELKFL